MASNPRMNAYLAGVIEQTMPEDNSIRTGQVSSVDGLTVGVLINGGIVTCGYLSTWTPRVGQTVALLRQGADWLVLGPTAGPAIAEELAPVLVSETKYSSGSNFNLGTTYEDDPHLFVDNLPPSGLFGIELFFTYASLSTGINTRFTYPSGATTQGGSFFYDGGATIDFQALPASASPGIAIGGFPVTTGPGIGQVPVVLRGTIAMGGTGGRLQWQRGQVSAAGTSSIIAGSMLRVWRLNYRLEG